MPEPIMPLQPEVTHRGDLGQLNRRKTMTMLTQKVIDKILMKFYRKVQNHKRLNFGPPRSWSEKHIKYLTSLSFNMACIYPKFITLCLTGFWLGGGL